MEKRSNINRRDFLQMAATLGIGISLYPHSSYGALPAQRKGKRIGIIGLDTSHSIEFVRTLNAPDIGDAYEGYTVTAAYPYGSREIKSSYSRIEDYTKQVKKHGVTIASSLDELLKVTDVIMLETNDGRLHKEQAKRVFEAGKTVFIDKPVAASYRDVVRIYEMAEQYKVPLFSSSTLRYVENMEMLRNGSLAGKILGADTFCPCEIEPSHPDIFWYGVHGVEMLFAVMGIGCSTVQRVHTASTDIVTGVWEDGRTGVFRGTRTGVSSFGGMAYGEKGNVPIKGYNGYEPLLHKIIDFYKTGIPPVSSKETIELYAFMEAADESKRQNGKAISLAKLEF
ncbi:Gfo/Idh/MocA family protein [Chitinophaga defluvii]|uniref:Gfo/Idh/MocA family oxidoreductase n=1 Tax=Chitinophaga defluvii TaxID=3163343 RepID=A0ABV2TBA6_9BACT